MFHYNILDGLIQTTSMLKKDDQAL